MHVRPVEVDEAFAALTNCLPNGARRIVLAVSGGPDSLALLVLAAENRQRFQSCGQMFLVVVVDHGLRDESAAEAHMVADMAAAHGFACRVMHWHRGTASGNLSARARDGRYALLCEAARAFGATVIVTAHHQDDQIETHLMAAERGEGMVRRAAMRACRDLAPGLVLCRPFLGLPKERLTASLRQRGIAWADDPGNLDPRYRRGQLRQQLRMMNCDERARVLHGIEEATTARDAADRSVSALLPSVVVDPQGAIRFDLGLLRSASQAANAFLSRALAAAGGSARPASSAEITRLLGRLLAHAQVCATLGGCRITLADATVELWREFGRSGPPAIEIEPGRHYCFDERFDLHVPLPTRARRIVPLGALGRGDARRSTLPVVLDEEGRVIGGHAAARLGSDEAAIRLDFRERVSWRLFRDRR